MRGPWAHEPVPMGLWAHALGLASEVRVKAQAGGRSRGVEYRVPGLGSPACASPQTRGPGPVGPRALALCLCSLGWVWAVREGSGFYGMLWDSSSYYGELYR